MKLREYQKELVAAVGSESYGALFLSPGLGKTIIILKAIAEAKARGEKIKVLILAPIRVTEAVWRQEAKLWGLDLKFSLIRGKPAERKANLRADADVYLLNFEGMQWSFDQPEMQRFLAREDIKRWLVVDESTMLKSPKTKRWKALRTHLGMFHKRWILTGTPVPNTYLDLWTQIGMLDRGKRLGATFSKYCNTYFAQDYMGYSWTPKEGSTAAINSKIKDVAHRVVLEKALVEEPMEVPIDIELSPQSLLKYKEMEKESIAAFYDALEEEDKEVPALSAAALHMKLSQLAQGFIYDLDKNAIEFHREKIRVIEEEVEGLNGESCIVVYKFLHEVEQLRETFGKDFVCIKDGDSNLLIEQWNDKKIRVFGIHPRSGGHGINLQFGGSHMIMTSPMYNPEHYEQLIRRLARPGQLNTVINRVIRCKDTVDMSIENQLGVRTNTQKAFLEYVTRRKV